MSANSGAAHQSVCEARLVSSRENMNGALISVTMLQDQSQDAHSLLTRGSLITLLQMTKSNYPLRKAWGNTHSIEHTFHAGCV